MLPVADATVNLLVLISKSPSIPAAPATPNEDRVVAPAPNVPATTVLPVADATVNLFVLTSKSPPTLPVPVTSRFPPTAPLFVTDKLCNVAKAPTLNVESITPAPSTFKLLSTSKSFSIVTLLLNVAFVLLAVRTTWFEPDAITNCPELFVNLPNSVPLSFKTISAPSASSVISPDELRVKSDELIAKLFEPALISYADASNTASISFNAPTIVPALGVKASTSPISP